VNRGRVAYLASASLSSLRLTFAKRAFLKMQRGRRERAKGYEKSFAIINSYLVAFSSK
jgi:hypothetical protein